MSILARIAQQSTAPAGTKLFAVVAGQRCSGKTTLAGTLKGKTLLLQASVWESGAESAKKLAAQLGNDLTAYGFESLPELHTILKELETDEVYDNVFVDGLSAITEIKYREPAVVAMSKKDTWAGWRAIAEESTDVILQLKSLTYKSKTKKNKNVFLTIAIDVKADPNGMPVEVEMVAKGQVAISNVSKFAAGVLTVALMNGEKGVERKLITRNTGVFAGRLEGLLDSANPGIMNANLSEVLNLIQSTTK